MSLMRCDSLIRSSFWSHFALGYRQIHPLIYVSPSPATPTLLRRRAELRACVEAQMVRSVAVSNHTSDSRRYLNVSGS